MKVVLGLALLALAGARADYGSTYSIVESIPMGMPVAQNASIYDSWMGIITSSKYTLDIAAFYVTLRDGHCGARIRQHDQLGLRWWRFAYQDDGCRQQDG